MLLDLKEFERALELAEKALAVFQQVLPEGHPNIQVVAGWCKEIEERMKKIEN